MGYRWRRHKPYEYDHRKAEHGQNSYGSGGRRILSDASEEIFEGECVNERISDFRSSRKYYVPRRGVEQDFLSRIEALLQKLPRRRH